ncbi:MAG: ferredoxin family protein [Deltaproteobacteria bacterium]|nr:ferredoxin family protein [Deltaproteobacteria bacterium]
MGIRHIDTELCNGCGLCVQYCPMDVIRMDKERKKAYVKYIRDCQSCFLCQEECPQNAILCIGVFERRIPSAW